MGKRKGGLTAKSAQAIAERLASNSKPTAAHYDPKEIDELDEFEEDRDRVLLEAAGIDSDDDDDGNEAVLGLDADSDDDDDGDSDGDSDGDDDDDNDDENEDEERAWGKKKDYYQGDVEDESDQDEDDAMQEEEQEARRLQKKKTDAMDEDVFGDVSLLSISKKKSKVKTDDKVLLRKMNEDLDALDTTTAEKIERNTAGMSVDDKLQIIINDAPELLELTSDFKDRIHDVREKLEPLIREVKDGKRVTAEGLSYLEAKHHLLLSYCINICFYMMLKASGKSVKSHPVIEHLVKTRALIEKMRPLDKKLKYQIDKLIRNANDGSETATGSGKDKMSLKPNLTAMEDADAVNEEGAAGVDAEETDGLYKPPRMTAMAFEDASTKAMKTQKKEEKKKRLALKSKMLRDLASQHSERPEEIRDITGWQNDMGMETEGVKDRTRYEEENFMRIAVTKKDKQAMNSKRRPKTGLEDITDFGDLRAVTGLGSRDKTDEKIEQVMKKRSLADHIASSDTGAFANKKKRSRKMVTDEDDYDMNDMSDRHMKQKTQEPDHYSSALAANEKKKEKRSKKDASAREQQVESMVYDDDEADGKRGITRQIEKNKGLVASRKKELRNPRVKGRRKYERAITKRKSQVQDHVPGAGAGNDGFASTGIRSRITKGTKL